MSEYISVGDHREDNNYNYVKQFNTIDQYFQEDFIPDNEGKNKDNMLASYHANKVEIK